MIIKRKSNRLHLSIVIILFSINITYSKSKIDCEDLSGVWLLIEKTPLHKMDSNPNGMINSKFYFDSGSSRLTVSNPDFIEEGKEQTIDYECNDSSLIFKLSEKNKITQDILSLNNNILKLRFYRNNLNNVRVEYYQIYKKQVNKSPVDLFEPYSIEVLKNNKWGRQLNMSDVDYDKVDYSSQNLTDRILGVWEVNKYEDVPRNDFPPYGFLNDIYVISKDQFCVYSQHKDKKHCGAYSLEKTILNTHFNSNTLSEDLSFNKWGHLVLTSMGIDVSLKLISKNVDKIPHIPVKIVLTNFSK